MISNFSGFHFTIISFILKRPLCMLRHAKSAYRKEAVASLVGTGSLRCRKTAIAKTWSKQYSATSHHSSSSVEPSNVSILERSRLSFATEAETDPTGLASFRKRLKMEASTLPLYSYLEATGCIRSMRKTAHQIETESSMESLAPIKGTTPVITIPLPYHLPRLHISYTKEDINRRLKFIRGGDVLSFDMEWFNNGKTSVIQLASATDIYILQLKGLVALPVELLRIIGDGSIIKCGVAIKDDAKKLKRDYGNEAIMAGVIDLSNLAKAVDLETFPRPIKATLGLKTLCQLYLGKRLSKGATVSDWNRRILQPRQIHYAANDVYVGIEILNQLVNRVAVDDELKDPFEQEEVQALLKRVEDGIPEQRSSLVSQSLKRLGEKIRDQPPSTTYTETRPASKREEKRRRKAAILSSSNDTTACNHAPLLQGSDESLSKGKALPREKGYFSAFLKFFTGSAPKGQVVRDAVVDKIQCEKGGPVPIAAAKEGTKPAMTKQTLRLHAREEKRIKQQPRRSRI